jgi:hypothetical protein
MKDQNKRIILMLLGVISMLVVCVVFGFIGWNNDDSAMERVVGLIAIISGVGSVLVGLSSISTTSLDNVREYFATGEDPEIADARHVLYNYRNLKIKYGKSVYDADFEEWLKENVTEEDKDFYIEGKEQVFKASSRVANFYQMWGLLQDRNFLPIWVFDTTSGYNMIRLYQSVADIIEHKREANPLYAGHFENLCKRINKKYKKVIKQCRDSERKLFLEKYNVEDIELNECFNMEVK